VRVASATPGPGIHQQYAELADRPGQQEQGEAEAGGEDDRAPEHGLLLGLVLAAKAWATKPVVPERRKLNVVKTMSKMIAPTARPPISAASPNWPITAVSTMPRIGVVRKASVIGTAMEKTMRLVTSKGRETRGLGLSMAGTSLRRRFCRAGSGG
jgi:hypothetical protein